MKKLPKIRIVIDKNEIIAFEPDFYMDVTEPFAERTYKFLAKYFGSKAVNKIPKKQRVENARKGGFAKAMKDK